MGERQFGPYRLVRQIAVGGMAEIHLAKTKGIAGFEKYVALKMIHPNFAEDEAFIQMLVDEAKIAVQLAHGNIAQTFDLGRVGDTYYITMEYVDGADLYKILRKGSEMDLEMPLDCCAFIAKEIASALDHAHRKKDHVGKPLGIVHRDVSPQNVLVSYSGEVKLVDFGIAKATMKARQTAVGVIKGKYYYMSPEQAWGDPIDFRSDIFSAGIVLYEMITGQMLYLEEDLHRLLDMARKADIAPPSKLRKGIPPQLEKIVMHALQKVPGERYQSASDLASDLERFLHAYSPVFTAAKVSGLLRQIVGDPVVVNNETDFPDIEVHDGANATFTLDTNDLVHAGDELRDENSVIFQMDELKPNSKPVMQARSGPAQPKQKPQAVPEKQERAPTAPTKQIVGAAKPAPSARAPGLMTRAHAPTEPPPAIGPDKVQRPPTGNLGAAAAPIPSLKPSAPKVAAKRPPSQPRKPTDDTRQLDYGAPAADAEDSGPIEPGSSADPSTWTHGDPADDDDLANIGESTMITTPAQMRGFMRDAGEEIEATMVSGPPVAPDPDTSDDEMDTQTGEPEDEAVEDPTIARDFRAKKPSVSKRPAQPPPAALAAKIHAPAVSELRKPRPSKRTPQGGVPQANVLQAIVAKQSSEPMPVPRAPVIEAPPAPQPPPQFPHATPGAQQAAPPFPQQQIPSTGYATDASGLPLGIPTPPGMPAAPDPNYGYQQPPYPYQQPQYQQPYPQQPGYPPQFPPGHPGYAIQPSYPQQQPYPGQPMTPGALYSMQPAPQPMTLTGQLRLFEVDEMPSQYKLGAARRRWFTYIVAGLVAISVAAAATFLIIRSTRETAPTVGSVHVESIPSGAEVVFDDVRLAGTTPLNIPSVPVNTRHTIKVELKRHERYSETIDIPSRGGEVTIKAVLNPMTGKLIILSQPEGAEIWINGEVRGRTPTTIKGVDMSSAKKLELRLKDHQPYVQDLVWPDNGQIQIDAKLKE